MIYIYLYIDTRILLVCECVQPADRPTQQTVCTFLLTRHSAHVLSCPSVLSPVSIEFVSGPVGPVRSAECSVASGMVPRLLHRPLLRPASARCSGFVIRLFDSFQPHFYRTR
jgi:hypothetical protein